jgi:hypothetical protein
MTSVQPNGNDICLQNAANTPRNVDKSTKKISHGKQKGLPRIANADPERYNRSEVSKSGHFVRWKDVFYKIIQTV